MLLISFLISNLQRNHHMVVLILFYSSLLSKRLHTVSSFKHLSGAVIRTYSSRSQSSSWLHQLSYHQGIKKNSSYNHLCHQKNIMSIKDIQFLRAAASHSTLSSSTEDHDKIINQQQPYPIIDVDCNLVHPDLKSLLSSSTNPIYTNESTTEIDDTFKILFHPSTKLSNIHAVFSPTSTIQESESFYSTLNKSTPQSRNGIDVRMSVGVHPYHVDDDYDDQDGSKSKITIDNVQLRMKQLLEQDIQLSNETCTHGSRRYITCIGETGLDYSEGFPEREKQLPYFKMQLEVAKEYHMPIFIHERLAFDDTTRLIDEIFPSKNNDINDPTDTLKDSTNNTIPPIIIHCFTGTKEECKEYIRRGYYISVSGYILKKGNGPNEVQQCIKDGIIPLDHLMIETDAPYMGFDNCRESFYTQEELMGSEEYKSLNSKKRKRLLNGIYPNVPSALPSVLYAVSVLVNEGREERGEEILSLEMIANVLYGNSIHFFNFQV